MLGERLKALREALGRTQLEVCTALNIEQSTLANYENNKRMPKTDMLIKIAEYYHCSVDYLLSKDLVNEEDAKTFAQKLAFQMDVNCTTISDLSSAIDVPAQNIIEWLSGTTFNCADYYQQLSEYFNVASRYWISPGMISPGIEPNTEEYLLILLYREYQKTGILNEETYGSLNHYFPGVDGTIPPDDQDWLDLIHQLPSAAQLEFRGEIKGYLRRIEDESAAESTLKQAK